MSDEILEALLDDEFGSAWMWQAVRDGESFNHPCPYCGSPVGRACMTRRGGLAERPHTARLAFVPPPLDAGDVEARYSAVGTNAMDGQWAAINEIVRRRTGGES